MCPNVLLDMLRKWVQGSRKIREKGDKISIGKYTWSVSDHSNYLVYGTGWMGVPGEFYRLNSILHFLQCTQMSHASYESHARQEKVRQVERQDRVPLLMFLFGNKWDIGDYLVSYLSNVFILLLFCR